METNPREADARGSLRLAVLRNLFSLAKVRNTVDDIYRQGRVVLCVVFTELDPEGNPINLGIRSSLPTHLMEALLEAYLKGSRQEGT
jgi:hypothetical protein